ncbi:MAG: malate dehydrogenase [Candidatus Omnitrophota bacterium]
MKVAVIGAGNVGGTLAMRLAEKDIADVVLVDVVKNLALAKASDIKDGLGISKFNHKLEAGQDISLAKGSQVVVITAGLSRKPGMTREDLLKNNAKIITDISRALKTIIEKKTIIIVVSNPVDLMSYLVYKETGLHPRSIIGMGPSLDASRFANLISEELKVSPRFVNTSVIGAHGETMVVLSRFSFVQGKPLKDILAQDKINSLVERTKNRGAEIVSLFGTGSAYTAPSLASLEMVEAIIRDERQKVICASAYLDGEYGLKDVFIGVPINLCNLGIWRIVQLDLNKEELEALRNSAASIKNSLSSI